ncbi:MAG TPA: hypothetical protein VL463_15125 [Kofleriaceae bacterium]|nr:hypothetical protein [Kofleriaceae bacterium]
MKYALLLALVACTQAPAAPPATCALMFGGNFSETTHAASSCPTLTDGKLAFTLESSTLGNPFAISIDLGPAPAAGTYSSETTSSWLAIAARSIGQDGACTYSAGVEVVPHGHFTLELTSIDASATTAHGTLDATLFVHAGNGTDCGAGDTESIHVEF